MTKTFWTVTLPDGCVPQQLDPVEVVRCTNGFGHEACSQGLRMPVESVFMIGDGLASWRRVVPEECRGKIESVVVYHNTHDEPPLATLQIAPDFC